MSRISRYIRSTVTLVAVAAASLLAAACADTMEPVAIASVTVSPAERSIVVGDELALTARVVDVDGQLVEGRAVAWTSTNQTVAQVSMAGLVTAVGAGTASIRATIDGKVGAMQLTVTPPPVARVEVNPTTLLLNEGETRTLVAMAFDANGQPLEGRNVEWMSHDRSVADVDDSGRLVAKAAGSTFVTAIVEERFANVTVTVRRTPVASIAITPTAIVVEIGKTRQLTALVFDATGNRLSDRVVTWLTDSPSVASVSASGLIAGVGYGYATITATSEGKTFSIAATIVEGEPDVMPFDLIYHRTTTQALGEIMILGTTPGSAPVKLNAGNVSRQPTASPNGNRIAFYVSQRDPVFGQIDDLFAVDRNGMNIKRITTEQGLETDPAWSPGGDRIAYRHLEPVSGRSEIWVMNADGSGKMNLTSDLSDGEAASSPAWSPDGSRLAFASTRSGFAGYAHAIWTMNADGSNKRMITSSLNGGDRNPTWSSDGASIAFIRVYGDDTDITITSSAGGTIVRLMLPGRQEGPAWSPDGRHFAFWQPVGFSGETAIYTVRTDGTNVRLHTTDPRWGGGYDPTWIRRF